VSSHDYRINAEVRRFLVSRWVDVSLLQIGTTNGVVYLMGSFEPLVEDALQRVGQAQERDPAQRLLRLLLLVEKEMRRLRGVRDVVFNLRNARRKGGIWRVKGPQGDVFLAEGKKKQQGTGEATQSAQAQDEASDDERTDTTPGTR
jgi:hypothetical protein